MCVCAKQVLVSVVFGPLLLQLLSCRKDMPTQQLLSVWSYTTQRKNKWQERRDTHECPQQLSHKTATDSQDCLAGRIFACQKICVCVCVCVCVRAKQVLVPIVFSLCFCNHFLAAKKRLQVMSVWLCKTRLFSRKNRSVRTARPMCARTTAFVHDLVANLSVCRAGVCRAGRSTRHGERNSECSSILI